MTTKLTADDKPIGTRAAPGAALGWPGLCSVLARMRHVYLLVALGLCGCVTPSVPLPPPDLQALTFTATTPGLVQVIGKPDQHHIGARFYVFDYNTGDGVITHASDTDGSFTSMPFAGGNGDSVQIYYDSKDTGERSQEVCTTLQLDVGLISMRCP